MITILITGCSMHSNDLIHELRNNYDNEAIRVVGTNCVADALLRNGVDAGYVIPRITEPDYLETMLNICKDEHVDVILPFITDELPILAKVKPQFEAIGTKVSVAPEKCLEKVGNKIALSKEYPELMPRQAIVTDILDIAKFAADIGYPDKKMCVKLPNKCGGTGFAVIDENMGRDITIYNRFGMNRYITLSMLKELRVAYDGDMIMQEYLDGTDYSMCVLADHGELLYGLGFEATLMSFGSAMFAHIKQNGEAYRIAEKITKDTGLDGNACFDFMILADGTVKLLEVNPRLSATLPFIAKAGLNLPYLRCRQLLGYDVRNVNPKINYGLKMGKRYESEYYV